MVVIKGTIYFIVQTKTHLRVKGRAIHNYPRITVVTWNRTRCTRVPVYPSNEYVSCNDIVTFRPSDKLTWIINSCEIKCLLTLCGPIPDLTPRAASPCFT